MQNQEEFIQLLDTEIQSLLESPPSYMRQISHLSHKIVSLQTKHILYVVNKIQLTIHDAYTPIKRKFLAFRFVKDTLLLASHSFYIFTVIRLLPFVIEVLREGQQQADNGLQLLIRRIAPKPQISNYIEVKTVSASLLQLLKQLIKWTGTNIKFHPFYTIPFSSVYKLNMDNLSKVKAIKITDLTYYTTDDIKVYEHNYLQLQLSSEEWVQKQSQFIEMLVNNWISLPQDDHDKTKSLKLLQDIVQTGDSLYIDNIVKTLKLLITSPITGYSAIELVHELMKIKQIEFCTFLRNQLMFSISHYILMMNVQKFSQIQKIDTLEILRQAFVWKIYSLKLGLKTEVYDQFFKKMKQEWIFVNQSQYTSKADKIEQQFQNHKYFLSSVQVSNRNKDKKNALNIKQDDTFINRIKRLEYHKKSEDSRIQMFLNDKNQNKSVRSMREQEQINKIFNKQPPENKENSKAQRVQPKNFQKLQSNSPIKQLNLNYVNESNQSRIILRKQNQEEFIRFDNSLNLSSQKQKHKSNIYTDKRGNQIKLSELSRSSRSNKSSKKSLHKLQKVSSLGYGVQKVKSSKLINFRVDEQTDKRKENIEGNRKSKNPNIMRFQDQFPQLQTPKISSAGYNNSISSDNRPYKEQSSLQSSVNKYEIGNINSNKLSKSRKTLLNKQVIDVQETVRKPKFNFSQPQDFYELQDEKLKEKTDKYKNVYTDLFPAINKSLSSFGANPSLVSDDKISKYSSIPSDFNVAFGKKDKKNKQYDSEDSHLGIKVNKFPNKIKQIEKEIMKTKEFQLLYQQKMKHKDEEYEDLLKKVPPTNDHIHQENKKLRTRLQEKYKNEAEKMARKQQKQLKSDKFKGKKEQIPFLAQKVHQLGKVEPFDKNFTKQLTCGKCLLEKNQQFQLGYDLKRQQSHVAKGFNYSICLYLKFKVQCQSFTFKFINQSLILSDSFQGTIVNIAANKQLKLEHKILGYSLFDSQFKIPKFLIQISVNNNALNQKIQGIRNTQQKESGDKFFNKLKQKFELKVPCSLFNFLEFHSPSEKVERINTKYAVTSRFGVQQFAASFKGQYLKNCFQCGIWSEPPDRQQGFYISYYAYTKTIKLITNRRQNENKVYFEQLHDLQRKQVNLLIVKLNGVMFHIESDNVFEQDRRVLEQITKMIAR